MAGLTRNLQVRYVRAPRGWVQESDFALHKGEMPRAGDREFVVANRYLSLDPYQRRMMMPGAGYAQALNVGDVMAGRTVGEVIESRHPGFPVGAFVYGGFGWQQYSASDGNGVHKVDPAVAPLSAYLGVLGSPGITAWVGLREIARPKPGETVIVSAAAGAVGSAAGQIAKIAGCRVAGIAGGATKCAYVTGALGFDACVDYKAPDFLAALAAATPAGVDVDFENVGGAVFDAVLARLNDRARVALCGLVSQYNLTVPYALQNVAELLNKNVMLQGFRIGNYQQHRDAAMREIAQWIGEGRLKYRETVADGLANAPRAFIGMLRGENLGKQLVRIA
jgi:NADPH-dependent curcumin reductase CurA